ncbi:hypothetical protein CEXT_533341 [Caerostris extrusa]|uniref:Uncharacterized protein n=1 Tax=Caerostris extrusa TaxID=172846 RepID=A0AAV4PPE4_CAEEX|nr:hypothetical protein CEXT_533341 [Caerostris extrusa]
MNHDMSSLTRNVSSVKGCMLKNLCVECIFSMWMNSIARVQCSSVSLGASSNVNLSEALAKRKRMKYLSTAVN